jgi:hypothetical protein
VESAERAERMKSAIPLLPRLLLLPLPPTPKCQQIGKQPERTRNSRRELPEKAQPGVYVGSFPNGSDEQTSGEWRLSRIVSLQHRPVSAIPASGKVEPTLLNPSVPICGGQPVRRPKQRVIGLQPAYGSALVHYPIVADRLSRAGSASRSPLGRTRTNPEWRPPNLQGVGGKASVEEAMLLILDDE